MIASDNSEGVSHTKFVAFLLLYFLLPIGVLFVIDRLDQPFNVSEEYRVRDADWVFSFSSTPPEQGWQAFSEARPRGRKDGELFTSVWYRFVIPPTSEPQAFFVPYPSSNIEIWLNGEQRLATGPARMPLRYQQTPIFMPLSPPTDDESGVLHLRLTRQASGGVLRYAYFAPALEAARDASEQTLINRGIPLVILAVMTTFGLSIGLMFYFRRRHTAYGWYALTVVLWGLHTGHALIESVPFSHFFWYSFVYVTLAWLNAELCFLNRYFDIPAPRLERVVHIVTATSLAVLIVVSILALSRIQFEFYYFRLTTPVVIWFWLLSLIVTSRYFVAVRRQWNFDSVSLWLSSGIVVVVGMRDLLYEQAPALNIPGSTYYLQFVVMIPLVLFGIQLIRRFAGDSRTAELRNVELNRLVDERSEALEHTYQRLSDEERRRVLAEERSRLMRDMHDGLGGQLVHALALSERGGDRDLERSLRLALDDLRLIVDSLAPTENSIHELIASYRHRVSKLLQRTGFSVEWQIDDSTDDVALKPNVALSILRIIQEAITNAVRHSGGDALLVSIKSSEEMLHLNIVDNGDGFSEATTERGLQNMRVRASEIGATLDIISEQNGTTVQVTLPLLM